MERSNQSERFTVADPARVPQMPVEPRRKLLYGLAALGAFAFSVTLALVIEFRKDTLLGEWELPANLRVLGRIPRINPSSAGYNASIVLGPGALALISSALSAYAIQYFGKGIQ